MPKGFTPEERDTIRARLIAAAHKLLENHTPSEISIAALTREAYISKGAFYLFFESKESLFYALWVQAQEAYRSQSLALIDRPGPSPQARFKRFFIDSLRLWRTSPLYRHFEQQDLETLMRKVAVGNFPNNDADDEDFMAQVIARCRANGITLRTTPVELNSIGRALVQVMLHETEIGAGFTATFDLLVDLVTTRLVDKYLGPHQVSD